MPSPVAHSLIGLALGMLRFLPRIPDWRQQKDQHMTCGHFIMWL